MNKIRICDRIVPIEHADAYREMREAIKNHKKTGNPWWKSRFFGVHAYRVTGFYKLIPLKNPKKGYKGRLIHCTKKEAEYVSGYGVCGIIRPISEVVSFGQVEWTQEQKKRARKEARQWIEREKDFHFMTRLYIKDDGKMESY